MKNLSVSRLPNGVLRKISRQVTNPAHLRGDQRDLIGVCEPLVARKTSFWTSEATHFIPPDQSITVVHSVGRLTQEQHAHPQSQAIERMGNEATEKQSRPRRAMCAEPAVAHGRKHDQPWKEVRAQSEGKGYDQIPRAKPKGRYHEQI